MTTTRIIFVCSGNTCRSPLAEALARRMAAERGLSLVVESAGTGALPGSPATDPAILVGIERGLDLSGHRSRAVTADMASPATLFLAMTTGHVAAVRAAAPDARVALLDDFASGGASRHPVPDPFGGDLEDYRDAADRIEKMLGPALDRLAAEQLPGRP